MRSLPGHLQEMKSVLARHTCNSLELGYRNELENGGQKAMVSRSMAGVGRGSRVATGVLVQRQENPVKLLLVKKKETQEKT